MISTYRIAAFVLLFAAGAAASAAQDNWPRWRGPRDNGSVESGSYPVKWDAEKVLWKAPLPGKGCSTPIVWNKVIYLTAPVDGNDAVLAFDWDGKPLWTTTFGPESPGKHRNGSGCNPSPATDGKAVFVNFKSGTLAAVELDGKTRWKTNVVERFGPDTLFWDLGTSPVMTRDCVVLARMHHGESWLAAFDKATGELRWKVARNFKTPMECDHGYTTPVVIEHRGREAVLVWGAEHVTVHDAADGSVLWSCGDFNPQATAMWPAIATPVLAGDVAVIAYGRNDRRQPLLFGIRLGGEGDVTGTHKVWNRNDTGTFSPTPVEYKGRVYLVRDKGEVECLDPATGETVWSDALPKSRSAYYASPLVAGGKLYAAREDGAILVADIEGGFKLLAENAMGEPVIASPVPASNRLFIRSEKHLFCVAAE
jgi:outer membrane protein assembly factor BamB